MKLAVALGWHVHPFDDLLALVRRAESLGYDAAYVDGDVSMIPSRGDDDVLHGWTVTTALLARTERIAIGSLRLVHHWNAAALAQAVATLERVAPGRLRFVISIGAQPSDARFGLALGSVRDRIEWLDETLHALRALWAGETVRRHGRFVCLDGAHVRPRLRGRAPRVAVAARRPRMLELVARHADVWEMNLPPVGRLVAEADAWLEAACRRLGRRPESVGRRLAVCVRPGGKEAWPRLRDEYRRLNPWFAELGEAELREAIVSGSPDACRARLAEIVERLRLDEPVLDLSGLPRPASESLLELCAPAESRVDSRGWST